MLQPPTILRQTNVHGTTVSSIRVHTDNVGGGYFETMLFLEGQRIEGLTECETYRLFPEWEKNHEALCSKVRSVMAYGPVLRGQP